MSMAEPPSSPNFIRDLIEENIPTTNSMGGVVTRFPPEPNGHLHIGHAKSICVNFGIAQGHAGGRCHLRFDDTNPNTEDLEYVESIKTDVRWLGFDWGNHLYYASDNFDRLYQAAVNLIQAGKAYVCSLSPEETKEYRGTLTDPGRDSPYRIRTAADNLDLFQRMRAGAFEEGTQVLRAKIDMASPNLNMRDPILYRILRAKHHRTLDTWCIYPTYDFAHSLSDAFEGITHSLCTLEFEDHRPLYDWILQQLVVNGHPQQIEFARLNISYTILSKRRLLDLVEGGYVTGWDDPRMPTLSGLRRRGYTPESIRKFCDRIGVAKRDSTIEVALLEHSIREDLNIHAPRAMAVLRPLRVVIDNYPENEVEQLDALNNPENPQMGTRKIPFSRVLYIEQEDFRENPPANFFRLAPGREVRLRYAYYVTCVSVIKDEDTGEVMEVHCTYDPDTKGGAASNGRKVKGTIHWVSVAHAIQAEVRLYDRLFNVRNPASEGHDLDLEKCLNPTSVEVLTLSCVETHLAEATPGSRFQFERQGYFCVDVDSSPNTLVFNRTVPLRDTWGKENKS